MGILCLTTNMCYNRLFLAVFSKRSELFLVNTQCDRATVLACSHSSDVLHLFSLYVLQICVIS